MTETSPTARALRTLELLQLQPGITSEQLGERLGVSDRAARRYVAILREAGIPVDAERGPYGGYRVGRGTRPPPLLFTTREALALVMAVVEGPHPTDPGHPVGSALEKFVRVLPRALAAPADAVRAGSARGRDVDDTIPDPELTADLVAACTAGHRVRVGYRRGPDRTVEMDLDPWAVVVRHGRWYLVCWSHTSDARRILRVDRVARLEALPDTFEPPADLDPLAALEDQLAQGWSTRVVVEVEAPVAEVRLARSLGRLARSTRAAHAWSPAPTTPSGTPGSSPACARRTACSSRSRCARRPAAWVGGCWTQPADGAGDRVAAWTSS